MLGAHNKGKRPSLKLQDRVGNQEIDLMFPQ